MKKVKIFHNPGAGEADHTRQVLTEQIESNGFQCVYTSLKDEKWKIEEPGMDILAIAGGDGTVRKVAKKLMRRRLLKGIWPIGLLPLGTANNVATALHLTNDTDLLIQSWQQDNRKKYDVGRICFDKQDDFFLEGFGFGIFPYLITEMLKREKPKVETPEESMQATLEKLLELILVYKARACELIVDGQPLSGKYILLEIMNTRSIGPNIFLSPSSDPGDGIFDLVLIPETDREKFGDYIKNKLAGMEVDYDFHTLPAKEITIRWDGTHVHTDDEVMEISKLEEVRVSIKPSLLEFLVP
jgi:diacylglycerol kinase (ATP)